MPWWLVPVGLMVLLCFGLWCAWTATRLDRMHLMLASARSGLDAALVRRSAWASDLALSAALDPASSVALIEAAATARDARPGDWQPQSDLTAVLRVVAEGAAADSDIVRAGRDVAMARRIHNDVAVRARGLHDRRRVRWLRLAGHAERPATIEFDAGDGHLSA